MGTSTEDETKIGGEMMIGGGRRRGREGDKRKIDTERIRFTFIERRKVSGSGAGKEMTRRSIEKEENEEDHEERNGEEEEHKDRRKEKKAKKSKKKNKKKDKESESEDDDKENKKKKKKSKKKKEKESEEEEEEQKEEVVPEHKPLVPYEEAEEPKTNEESVDEDATEKSEKEEEKPSIDPTKFINSFSETVVEEVKPKLKLPTLIFNEKTVELAPRAETKSEPEQQVGGHKANDQEAKKGSDSFADSARTQAMVVESRKTQEVGPERSERLEEASMENQKDLHPLLDSGVDASVASKWDLEESFIGESAEAEFALQLNVSKDEFNGMELESPQKDLKEEEGPTTVLKKALENIKEKEKDITVKKKRRSTNGGSDLDPEEHGIDTKKRKKKKKKKVDSGADESSDEDMAVKTKKKAKGKKKRKGQGRTSTEDETKIGGEMMIGGGRRRGREERTSLSRRRGDRPMVALILTPKSMALIQRSGRRRRRRRWIVGQMSQVTRIWL